MGMNREFTPYDRALKLKELGFDEPCITKYVETSRGFILELTNICTTLGQLPSIDAPTFSQAFRWFREKYGLHSIAGFDKFIDEKNDIELDNPYFTYYYSVNELWDNTKDYKKFLRGFRNLGSQRDLMSLEEAELACLDKLIEIVESKNK
jgi:hypothetical protein